jgi:predicted metal-dependent phosphoesterase TrpH
MKAVACDNKTISTKQGYPAIFDLHSHTTFSDGVLTPRQLILRAVEKGVNTLAITDHDTLFAYRKTPLLLEVFVLVTVFEISTQCNTTGIHVLGLNIDLDSEAINTAALSQSSARLERAMRISERLEKKGIKDAFNGARKLSAGGYIGRPHFAQYLINIGKVESMSAAFKKYMGDGKAGDVKQHWAELAQVIQWIRDANGIAVLAHPLKYKLTRTRLKRLLDCFMQAGGQGMEVISGRQLPQQTRDMARLCEQMKLLASCGSDFHMPDKPWAELGAIAPLPGNVIPVWDQF